MAPRSLSHRQSENHKRADRGKLGPGGNILKNCALAHAKNIHERLDDNRTCGNQVPAGQGECPQSQHRMIGSQCRENLPQIFSEPRTQRRHRSRNAYGKDHPSIKEGGKLAVSLADVNILSAGLREHRAHLGEGKAGEHGDDHANRPDREEKKRRPRIQCNVFGGKEDAGADDPARQQQNGISQRESANELVLCGQCGEYLIWFRVLRQGRFLSCFLKSRNLTDKKKVFTAEDAENAEDQEPVSLCALCVLCGKSLASKLSLMKIHVRNLAE